MQPDTAGFQSRWQPFHLRISAGPSAYEAEVLVAPAGGARSTLRRPFTDRAAADLLDRAAALLQPGARHEELRALGAQLFAAIMPGEVAACWQTSLALMQREGAGLRLLLQVDDSPELDAVPWEYLYDRDAKTFLLLDTPTSLVRYHAQPTPPISVRAALPLRVLEVSAQPTDWLPTAVLAGEHAQRRLLESSADGGLVVERLLQATAPALQSLLREWQPHIVHFRAPCGADDQGGYIVLENESGRGRQLSARELAALWRGAPEAAILLLDPPPAAEPNRPVDVQRLARGLVRGGLPGAIASQIPLPDAAARILYGTLYGGLAAGRSLEDALVQARLRLAELQPGAAWGAPSLHTAAVDGSILEVVPPAAEMQPTSGTGGGSALYALLVGISHYASPTVPALRGAVNDARALAELLQTRLPVGTDRLQLLLDAQATRAAILAGWRSHLGQATAADQVLFYFSGHGSRTLGDAADEPDSYNPDSYNPDSYDESLVPYDSRTPGVYDILDLELAPLAAELAARGVQVTIILECSFGGAGTRQGTAQANNEPRPRRIDDDRRPRPQPKGTAAPVGQGRQMTAGFAPASPTTGQVTLTACRPAEECYEFPVPGGAWHGLFTYALLETLRAARPESTWQEAIDRIRARVQLQVSAQTPQLEGAQDRPLFGGLLLEPTHVLTVTAIAGSHIEVDRGAAAGLTVGSRLALYPAGAALEGTPQAQATVTEVLPERAVAELDAEDRASTGSRARLAAVAYTPTVIQVAMDDPELQLKVATLIDDRGVPLVVPASPTDPYTDYQVVQRDDHLAILGPEGELPTPLPLPVTEEGRARTARLLRHLAQFANVRALRNPIPDSELAAALELEVATYTRLGRDGQPLDPTPVEPAAGPLAAGQRLAVTIRNRGRVPLALALFNLSPDYAVRQLHPPRSSNDTLQPGQQRTVQFELALPAGASGGQELLKVIGSREPVSFAALRLPELGNPIRVARERPKRETPLTRLWDGLAVGAMVQTPLLFAIPEDDTWTTTDCEFWVVAPHPQLVLEPGATRLELATDPGLVLDKPARLLGTVTVLGTQSTADQPPGAEVAEPPASMAMPGIEEWATLLRHRGSGQPLALALQGLPGSFAVVGPDDPLVVEVALPLNEARSGLLALCWDGEFYYLAGRSRWRQPDSKVPPADARLRIEIPALPRAAVTYPEAGSELQRTVTLFFYELFEMFLDRDPPFGLLAARLQDGTPAYEPVTSQTTKDVSRLALVVQGLAARTLFTALWTGVEATGGYDRCLIYDYDPFQTPLLENARLLAEALHSAGLGPDDGIEIDAYGVDLGSQVLRAWVELEGGDEMVDRVFMGGPPNGGSALAGAGLLVPWLCTLLLNQSHVPPRLVAEWALGRADDESPGIADLRPDSDFYRQLNGARHALEVPYFVQIGNAQAEGAVDAQRLFQRWPLGGEASLARLLGSRHDQVVSHASAEAVHEGRWPRLQIGELAVNHLDYFHHPASLELLSKWLAAAQVSAAEVEPQEVTTIPYALEVESSAPLVPVGGELTLTVRLRPFGTDRGFGLLDVPADASALHLALTLSGFACQGQNAVSLPLEPAAGAAIAPPRSAQIARFRLVALRSEPPPTLLLDLMAAPGWRQSRSVELVAVTAGIDPGELTRLQVPTRPRPVRQPDLLLQLHTFWQADRSAFAWHYTLNGVHLTDYRSRWLPAHWVDQIYELLEEILAGAEGGLGADMERRLASYGQLLFQQLMPNALWQSLTQAGGRSLLLLGDGDRWPPWELIHDGRHFWAERFVTGRWPRELAAMRPYEFPLGPIRVAYYADVDHPQRWSTLLQPLNGQGAQLLERGTLTGDQTIRALRGLHILSESGPANGQTANLPVLRTGGNESQGSGPTLPPDDRLSLHRNRPLVSIGYLNRGRARPLRLDRGGVSALIQAGCSGVVGPLWAVDETVDSAFQRGLYDNLWRGQPLGDAFAAARRLAQLVSPQRPDWLAYLLYGDPMARPYRPVLGEGYAVVEPVGWEFEDGLEAGAVRRLRISLSRTPPVWHNDRVVEVVAELELADLQVQIVAADLTVVEGPQVTMQRLGGDYMGWCTLQVPVVPTRPSARVQVDFADAGRPLHTVSFSLHLLDGGGP